MRRLEGREVRAIGGGLLEDLGGGVEQLRPAAHLRISSAAAPAGADAGHRRRRWRFSWGVFFLCAPAPRSSCGV